MPQVTSGSQEKVIDGKIETFRTITTIENFKVKNTKILQLIDPEAKDASGNSLVDKRKIETPDLVTDIGGKSYVTISDGNIDPRSSNYQGTIYADINVRKALKTTGKNSLTTALQFDSITSIANSFDSSKPESNPYNWFDQYPVFGNVDRSIDDLASDAVADLSNAVNDLGITGIRQTEYKDLVYPLDIAQSGQDRIKFSMFEKSGRTISIDFNSQNVFNFGDRRETEKINGSVTLPIQGGIQDQNKVDFTESTLNPVTGLMAAASLDPGAAGSAVLDFLKQSPGDIQKSLASQEAKNTINALKVYLAQSAVGAQGLVPRLTGAILNPNVEYLFKSPSLRSFKFQFRMSARSAKEASEIKQIIRFFKQGMSVKRSQQNLFLVTPNMFRIRYISGTSNNDHPSIGKIKECALTDLNTNYTPDGTYMTYDDPTRTMTSYEINMQFTELEPLTENDYNTGPIEDDPIFSNDNQIGY